MATTRGSRSGRTAWQFIQDFAGILGKPLGISITKLNYFWSSDQGIGC